MAAVKRLDLTQQLFNGNEDVQHKPPLGSKQCYTIQKFHKSSLFPSTVNKKLYQDVEDKIISENLQKRPSSSNVNAPKPPIRRLERTSITAETKAGSRNLHSEFRNDNPLTCYNKNNNILSDTQRVPPYEPDIRYLNSEDKSSDTENIVKNGNDFALVPVGGKPVPVIDVGWDAPYPEYHYLSNAKEKYKSSEIRPFLTPAVDVSMLSRPLDNSNVNKVTNNKEESNLKPSVYGLSWQRQVYGSESDLTKVDDSSGPYKLSSENNAVKKQTPSQKSWEKSSRKLPESLQPLGPWLTENISELLIGVDPKKCLVFLPSLVDVDYEDIPEVPLPHNVNEDLPYKEKLLPAELPPPKKYEHPSFVSTINKKIGMNETTSRNLYSFRVSISHSIHFLTKHDCFRYIKTRLHSNYA
ncbi:LOW QUALITY PROTEIN: hypothetical protein KUTeg_003008 [Tegillarca granosa]|uniref:Uncharacterized protein n=1 Tax=Tegillarca granosa TaxID=220873 RepID=A0ABQ9FKV6_TEGGR|nr:LOW QUALITY PROTEIN: hypothetical protein KUTeg_003008 [Tegillarca granosa]